MWERNKITIKMTPHKKEQSTKINTESECTQELIETTIVESQSLGKAVLMVNGNSTCCQYMSCGYYYV